MQRLGSQHSKAPEGMRGSPTSQHSRRLHPGVDENGDRNTSSQRGTFIETRVESSCSRRVAREGSELAKLAFVFQSLLLLQVQINKAPVAF